MSGGGSGSSSYIPQREEGKKTKCNSLSFLTNLSSPVPAIINNLRTGAVLQIELDPRSGVIGAYYHGRIAGTLTSDRIAELLRCMNDGYSYIATVQSINGGDCRVLISTP